VYLWERKCLIRSKGGRKNRIGKEGKKDRGRGTEEEIKISES
jgi:hypothetical protein